MEFPEALLHEFGKWCCQEICKSEYQSQKTSNINERPAEYQFVFKALARVCPTTVLDIGTGKTALPHLIRTCGHKVTAIDNINDYWPEGMFNRHFHIIHDDITETKLKDTFDFISCVSVLEHIKDYDKAVRSIFNLLRPNGHAVITFPYNEEQFIENAYELPEAGYGQNAPYICRIFSRKELDRWLKENNAIIVEQEYWRVFNGEFWTYDGRCYPLSIVRKNERHHLTCVLIRIA